MEHWTADFVNDPFDDYNIMIEIHHNNEDVAAIKRGDQGLEIKLYQNNEDLTVSFDWFLDLLLEAKKRMSDN